MRQNRIKSKRIERFVLVPFSTHITVSPETFGLTIPVVYSFSFLVFPLDFRVPGITSRSHEGHDLEVPGPKIKEIFSSRREIIVVKTGIEE